MRQFSQRETKIPTANLHISSAGKLSAAAGNVGPCEPRACEIVKPIIFGSISIAIIYAGDLKVMCQDNTVELVVVLVS